MVLHLAALLERRVGKGRLLRERSIVLLSKRRSMQRERAKARRPAALMSTHFKAER
jgi:hypothetical protein